MKASGAQAIYLAHEVQQVYVQENYRWISIDDLPKEIGSHLISDDGLYLYTQVKSYSILNHRDKLIGW